MTKADLINILIQEMGMSKKNAEVVVNTFLGSMIESLKNGKGIELRGFGSFRIRERKPRIGRNPQTGEKVKVPAKKIVYFKPGKELKEFTK